MNNTTVGPVGPWGLADWTVAAWRAYAGAPVGGAPPEQLLGRVIAHHHHLYECVPLQLSQSGWIVAADPLFARVSGRFEFQAAVPADFPAVGDWVALDVQGRIIHAVLPRRTTLTRHRATEETIEQVILANVDVVLIVCALDGGRNFLVRFIERALTTVWASGAQPVIVLNKSDVADEQSRLQAVVDAQSVAPGVPIHALSAKTGVAIADLIADLPAGATVGMIGKSGVGKSALINAIERSAARRSATGPVRPPGSAPTAAAVAIRVAKEGHQRASDLRGRHTTTHKVLYPSAAGFLIADVPGLRELQLWSDEQPLDSTFADVESLATDCRFNDCTHQGEPGCAVQAALSAGELDYERFNSYLQLRKEIAYLERRRDHRAAMDEQLRWKRITKSMRKHNKRG